MVKTKRKVGSSSNKAVKSDSIIRTSTHSRASGSKSGGTGIAARTNRGLKRGSNSKNKR
jgi:hypothetical protein